MTSALKDYLQRYVGSGESDGVDIGKAKLKKKRKGKHAGGGAAAGNAGKGVVIVDNDALWHKEEKAEDEAEPDEEGDEPVVIEDVEVKRMQRMEAMKMHRPYLSMANDGSGWVTVREDAAGAAPSDNSRPRSRSPRGGKSSDVSVKRKRNDDSPDLSPPLRRRHDSPDVAPGRRRLASEDLSPPRKRNDSPDLASPPRRRHDSPDVAAPGRRLAVSEDLSPPRKSKNSTRAPKQESPLKLTPPRRRRDSPDLSPARRRHDSPPVSPRRRLDSDYLSLPRRSEFVPAARNRNQTQDLSPPRKRRDSRDLSPPRRRQDSDDEPLARKASDDLSPPRRSKFSTGDQKESRESVQSWKSRDPAELSSSQRKRHDSPEMSSPRRSKTSTASRYRSEAQDLSPPRTRRASSPDVEKVRRGAVSKDSLPMKKPPNSMAATNLNEAQDSSPPRKNVSGRMGDGSFAGLKSDREVVSEAERKRAAEAKFLSELDPSLSGRGAETVFRDKRGRRLEGLEEMLRQQKGAAKPVEEPLEWGKGLAQKKVADASRAELEAEKSKPFARYRDDADLDKALKDRVRFGDPMAHLVKTKIEEPVLVDLGASEEMKASGFIIPQEIPKHSWLKAGRAPPPNRYDIRPGRHWDGVDRSTGFEQGLFKQRNEKKAREQEAYLWSVADM